MTPNNQPAIALQFAADKKARDARKRLAARGIPQEPYSYDRRSRKPVRTVYADPELNKPESPKKPKVKICHTPEFIARRKAYIEQQKIEEREKLILSELKRIDDQLSKLTKYRNKMNGYNGKTMKQIAVEVIRKYSGITGVSFEDFMSRRRHKKTCFVRFEVYYRCKTETPNSFPCIGREFDRDNTTILHGVNKYKHFQLAKKGQVLLSESYSWVPLDMIIDAPEVGL